VKPADERVKDALQIAHAYGGCDGAHHKMWTIDQMVRVLLGGGAAYRRWVTAYQRGEDGPETYLWDEGTPP
jgi:hypothetical protein